MKTRVFAWVVMIGLGAAAVAQAAPSKSEAERLRNASDVLKSFRASPDTGIPDYLWDRAQCAIVIPSMKKAGFVFGGEYGKGVVTCRTANGWSAPAFVQLEKGSWGAQIGGEEIDLVMLAMNRQGIEKLLNDKISLGAGVSVAAGPVGRAGSASTDLQLKAEILSYSRSNGLFAGVDLSGGVLGPDKDANRNIYGPDVTPRAVLFDHTVAAPSEAAGFLAAIRESSRPIATSGRRK